MENLTNITGTLRRNPQNPHDPNAIEVHGPTGMLGHLSASVASYMAPMIDRGIRYHVLLEPRIDPDHPENPGVTAIVTVAQ